MKVELRFTAQGQQAIKAFENHEIIESFSRHMKTLAKKYMVITTVPLDDNPDIVSAGLLNVLLETKSGDAHQFFRELGRDMRNPLNKRFDGKLGSIFKVKLV